MTTELTKSERKQIAEILDRRANEIAGFSGDYRKDSNHFGSVELALSREIERLRRLADRVNPPEPEDDDAYRLNSPAAQRSGEMMSSAARIKRKDDNMERQTGATTRQMEAAPHDAIFVWCNRHIDYPRALAQKIGRDDLKIVAPSWLDGDSWYGLWISGIVVDHAAHLSDSQQYGLSKVLTRVTPNVE